MIKAGIVGGTGYTGAELIRLLYLHPQVEIQAITSRSEAGRKVSELFPNFIAADSLVFTEPSVETLSACDVVFFATPNGTAMKMVPQLLQADVRVIDLAADFRLRDEKQWEQWYGEPHACPELLAEAVYGLPEIYRKEIQAARLIANPGCYPTAVILGLLPMLENDVVDTASLIADAKSGVSGAGRGAKVGALHAEVSENFKAYGVGGHRHWPEIHQQLATAANEDSLGLVFVPHLLPMIRGIHATLYGKRKQGTGIDLAELYRDRYAQEPFVEVLVEGQHPETRAVRGTNQCLISVNEQADGHIVVLSVIDNLVKGAAGQAIQNMNLMFACNEREGLELLGSLP